jgi:Fe-Mn family superoxide dismutase
LRLPYLQQTFEYHYGKHHATYLANLNNQVAGKDLASAASVHEVGRAAGRSPATARSGNQQYILDHAAPGRPSSVLLEMLPPPGLCSAATGQVMLKTWNGGSPGPEFNNAAQVVNHTFFWESMSPNGGGEASTGCT